MPDGKNTRHSGPALLCLAACLPVLAWILREDCVFAHIRLPALQVGKKGFVASVSADFDEVSAGPFAGTLAGRLGRRATSTLAFSLPVAPQRRS